MHFNSLVTAVLIGAVSALPGPAAPLITAAPDAKHAACQNSTTCASSAATTVCFASYATCYGSLTFLEECFTTCTPITYPIPSFTCPPKVLATETHKPIHTEMTMVVRNGN